MFRQRKYDVDVICWFETPKHKMERHQHFRDIENKN